MELVEIECGITGRVELRRVKDFLPLVQDGRQVGLFPMSGLSLEEICKELPHITVVDDDNVEEPLEVVNDDLFEDVEED